MSKTLGLLILFVVDFVAFIMVFHNRWEFLGVRFNMHAGEGINDIDDVDLEILENEILSISEELQTIKREKDTLQEIKQKEEQWMNLPAMKLLRKSQVAGDYVHYTNDRALCGQETLKLLIVVNTKYHEWKERQMIRETWGKHINFTVSNEGTHQLRWRYLFVMSNFPDTYPDVMQLRNEKRRATDILDIDLFEADVFMSMKFYGMLTWAINSCRFEYLLIVRPKSVVNIPKLYEYIHDGAFPKSKLYAGHEVTQNVKVPLKREPPLNKRRHEEKELTYINSDGLFLSHDVVKILIPDLKEMKNLDFKNPEVITGLICLKYGIPAWNIRRFSTAKTCNFRKRFILNSAHSVKCMKQIYEQSNTDVLDSNEEIL